MRANQSRSIIRVTTASQGNLPVSRILRAAVKHTWAFKHKLKHLNFTIYGMFEESPSKVPSFLHTVHSIKPQQKREFITFNSRA